jgi:AhpD family alkylhydroperoxidase
MPHIAVRDDLVGITSLLAARPEAAAPLCELTDVLLRGPSTLSAVERERIAAHVSALNECSYCTQAHEAAACALPGADVGPTTPKLAALLVLAGRVQQSGRTVTPEVIAAARAVGATDAEIHDTVLIAALFCLYNRYVDGLAATTPPDPAYYRTLGSRLASRGYRMPADGYRPLEVSSE